MHDNDALAAQSICEAIDRLVDDLAANEAVITSAMVLALGRRLAGQASTLDAARAGLCVVSAHLEALVEIHMGRKLGCIPTAIHLPVDPT